jgi:heme-degrading monooxygenase HmoA
MTVGQTMLSVRRGTEHRAEKALEDIAGQLAGAAGLVSHKILRSVSMSPLASALHDEAREAALGDVHFVILTEWESVEAHDDFYRSGRAQRAYAVLASILTSGPYEVLYEQLVAEQEHSGLSVL